MRTLLIWLVLVASAFGQLTIDCPSECPRDQLVRITVNGLPDGGSAIVDVLAKNLFAPVDAVKVEGANVWVLTGPPDRYLVRVVAVGDGSISQASAGFVIVGQPGPDIDDDDDDPNPDPDPPKPPTPPEPIADDLAGACRAIARMVTDSTKRDRIASVWQSGSKDLASGKRIVSSVITDTNQKTEAILGSELWAKAKPQLTRQWQAEFSKRNGRMAPVEVAGVMATCAKAWKGE